MWCKVVTYVGPRSDWQACYALQQQGPLTLLCPSPDGPYVFTSFAQVVDFARKEGIHIFADDLILYMRDR